MDLYEGARMNRSSLKLDENAQFAALGNPTAVRFGLLPCRSCGLLCAHATNGGACCCPRCGARLFSRKPNSIARTWAFLIAAYILYIPANLLPIMETRAIFSSDQDDTIMSGVVYLWVSGSWPLALVVFFASIMIPMFKLIAMTILTISVQRKSAWQPQQRASLFRFIDFVGRWSLLDIYVIALLVTLVQMKSFATVEAGPAAIAFGAVVVLTLLAANSFDPRLIWDFEKNDDDRQPHSA
jgi:paraquat-inducible protein A